MIRKFVLFILLAICSLSLPILSKYGTDSFHIARLSCPLPVKERWNVPSVASRDQIQQIFLQKFFYLARGAQAFVFLSEDQRYVLKLFSFHSGTDSLMSHVFYPDNTFRKDRDEKRAIRLLDACKLAAERVPVETGILFAHLNVTGQEWPRVWIQGPAYRRSWIALDGYRFVLQLRADPMEKRLLDAHQRRDRACFDELVADLIRLLHKRVSAGIYNTDPTLFDNFGFIGQRAVEIDFGGYRLYPDEISRDQVNIETARYIDQLVRWAKNHVPEWRDDIVNLMTANE